MTGRPEADPAYDEQAGEEWLFLKPEKWNKHVQYAWRYDPSELASQSAARPATARARRAATTPNSILSTHGSRMTSMNYDPSCRF